ncbi:MAG: glycosyltransferase [Proteobacteria bacterium]|nr:glycosyltransferase [Pseudomonadota bacterium]
MNYFDRLEAAKTAEYVVFIGYDPVEDVAAKMLARSIRTRTSMKNLNIIPIIRDQLLAYDIFNRPLDVNGSTQFSITRFLVPHLMDYKGIGIFFDCDMLITRDIQEMFDLYSPDFAVQCTQHKYEPSTQIKMSGKPQTAYPRKNWSSVVIYNCEHPSNKSLTSELVETSSPKYLHRFEWLRDEEIGEVPLEFNFLVEEQPMSDSLPFNIHHTLGAPLFREKLNTDYHEYWKSEFKATFGREFSEQDIIS